MLASQEIGTPQVVEAVAEAACAKPLEMQLPMFEVRTVRFSFFLSRVLESMARRVGRIWFGLLEVLSVTLSTALGAQVSSRL